MKEFLPIPARDINKIQDDGEGGPEEEIVPQVNINIKREIGEPPSKKPSIVEPVDGRRMGGVYFK